MHISPNTYFCFVAVHQQLLDYEQKIFGSSEHVMLQPIPQPEPLPPFGFGFPKTDSTSPYPMFNQSTTASIFERTVQYAPGNDFVFGAERNIEQKMMENNAFVVVPSAGSEAPMDSS